MTENALAVREDFTITPEDVRKFIAPNATEKEFGLLMGICKAHKLNPFIREVHFLNYMKHLLRNGGLRKYMGSGGMTGKQLQKPLHNKTQTSMLCMQQIHQRRL